MTQPRIPLLQEVLRSRGLTSLVATPGSDMAYLTGSFAHASERPQLLVVPAKGDSVLVISAFEARALPQLSGIMVAPYSETEDPYELAAQSTAPEWWRNADISDIAWAAYLLGLQRQFADARFSKASPVLRELRMIKSAEEFDCLRVAARIADAAMQRLLDTRFSGLTERQVALRLSQIIAEGEPLSEVGVIIASGPNGASPHHHTGDRTIETGDTVVVDFGGTHHGYWADMTRTVSVSEPSARQCEAYDAVRAANAAGAAAVRGGVTAESVDRAARDVIEKAGFGDAFIHRTGHGIGLDEHEEPYIVAGNDLVLGPGMTFSVEPGIYLDGEFGVRIEDIVAVTEDGCEVLNQTDRSLRVVG